MPVKLFPTACKPVSVPRAEDGNLWDSHLKALVEVCHLLGVFALGYTHRLLHLFGFGLDILAYGDELVYCSLEVANEGLWVKCYRMSVR